MDMSRNHPVTTLTVRLCWLAFFLSGQTSRAQLTVQGRVFGGSSQEPLPFANVFLSGTTKGTVTDATGAFKLTNVPSGKFDLIVSFVGFTTLKTTMQTGDPKTSLAPVRTQRSVRCLTRRYCHSAAVAIRSPPGRRNRC